MCVSVCTYICIVVHLCIYTILHEARLNLLGKRMIAQARALCIVYNIYPEARGDR